MNPPEQSREFDLLVARAKRAGLLKAHYPAERIAVLELPPAASAPPPADLTLAEGAPPPAE